MAIHHLTPPIRDGERPRLASAQRGPVTIALAAMQAADPDRQRIRELRRAIADRIEADIALLDALAGDPDLEDNGDSEPSLGSLHGTAVACAIPFQWAGGCTQDGEYDSGEDREEENEHGGDIQDEPHDPQVDDIQKGEHRWDPAMAGMARAARRQAEALRARMNRRGRA